MNKTLIRFLVALMFTAVVVGLLFTVSNKYLQTDTYTEKYFDDTLLLKKLPQRYYLHKAPPSTFVGSNAKNVQLACGALVSFMPLGYNVNDKFEYTHVYSPKCIYRVDTTVYRFAEVAFPNQCLSKDKLFATAQIINTSSTPKEFSLRLFYQNTTYWFPTNEGFDTSGHKYLDNFYGASSVTKVFLKPGEERLVRIPYRIGLDPKGEFDDDAACPARPGNYEFCLLVDDSNDNGLLNDSLNLQRHNPFADIQAYGVSNSKNNIAYTSAEHFKFVFLDERFQGINDTALGHIYVPFNRTQKKLCDTCSGWYKDVISEDWKHDDFNSKIADASMVKAEYGNYKENVSVSNKGIRLLMPGSTSQRKQKTWGEFFFGPAFKYGHLTIRAKLAPMMGKSRRPNGIIHNIWLYQRDYERPDTSNPYGLYDPHGTRKYEIDFEVWSSTREWQAWDDKSNINYGVVDYMQNPNVNLKPEQEMWTGKTMIDRFAKYSANIIGKDLSVDWFDRFHTFEILWQPDRVRMFVDGIETADFTDDLVTIPNRHLFLWVGSPMYQDGTYYTQSFIPFLESDKETIIDYIRID